MDRCHVGAAMRAFGAAMTDALPIASAANGSAPVVLGTTLLNGGDAALLFAEVATITAAIGHEHVVCYDAHADVARRYYPALDVRPALIWPEARDQRRRRAVRWVINAVRVLSAARALRAGRHRIAARLAPGAAAFDALETYRQAAAAFTPGGTMLVDQYRFVPRLVDALAALTLGTPLIMFTQTLGDFGRRTDRLIARRVFRRASLLLVRDERSRDRAIQLGADAARVHVVADPVFLLNDPDSWSRPRRKGLSVAVSVRDWPYFRASTGAPGQARYEAAIAAACLHLVRSHGAEITFVSTCQGVPEYAFDDSAVAGRIVGLLESDVAAHVTVDRAFHSPFELRALFGRFDLAISTRLHGCILALAAGTPAIAIAYEPKTLEVFERLGASDCVLDIESLNGPELTHVVDAVVATPEEQRRRLQAAVEREHDAARDVAGLIRDALAHHTTDPV